MMGSDKDEENHKTLPAATATADGGINDNEPVVPLTVRHDECQCSSSSKQLQPIGTIARIGMRSLETRSHQGGETSIPRKERRWCVRLVAPSSASKTSSEDDVDGDGKDYHGGLVAVAMQSLSIHPNIQQQQEHEDNMMQLEQERRDRLPPLPLSTTVVQTMTATKKIQDFFKTHSSALADTVQALRKRLFPSVFDNNEERPYKKRRIIAKSSSSSSSKFIFPITQTAHYAPDDSYVDDVIIPRSKEEEEKEDDNSVGGTMPNTTPLAAVQPPQDYNHFRLSGGAYRKKKQHPSTRAVSLVAMSVYDEMESVLKSLEMKDRNAKQKTTDKSSSSSSSSSSKPPQPPMGPRIAYGDIGENFTIAGISSSHQLQVGMRLQLGNSCPHCSGAVTTTTVMTTENHNGVTANEDDSTTTRRTPNNHNKNHEFDESPPPPPPPMIEICHVNNPCVRLNNVPWSSRALSVLGGNMWGHYPGKYGWWWSPQLPLNDETHPGGRGYLCQVIEGGVVYDGATVLLEVQPASSSLSPTSS